ncbi:MAG: hypothetical protein HY236_02280 [Acidobacteria bacterium]|nr:hypothetical protein [Acidobacteriota bacterium]
MSGAPFTWLAVTVVAAALLFVILLLWSRGRITPEERERRRRRLVNQAGRITDGFVVDVHTAESPSGAVSHLLHYSYDLHGMNYSASQDITALGAHLSRDPRRIAGPVSVKYLPGNPSNSIVICEDWSGLRD